MYLSPQRLGFGFRTRSLFKLIKVRLHFVELIFITASRNSRNFMNLLEAVNVHGYILGVKGGLPERTLRSFSPALDHSLFVFVVMKFRSWRRRSLWRDTAAAVEVIIVLYATNSFQKLFLGREQDCKSAGDITSSSRHVSVGSKRDTPSKRWRVSSLFCLTAQHLRSSLESVQCKYCHISEWSVPAVCVGDRKWERGQSANHHPAKL